jgi:hypothetical protein
MTPARGCRFCGCLGHRCEVADREQFLATWPGGRHAHHRERAPIARQRRVTRPEPRAAGIEPALHAALHAAAIVGARDDFLTGVAALVEGDRT